MVLLLTKHLEMDANYTGRCESEWGSKAITPLENELEEGEIGEEDDEIYVLAEFERKDANNGNCEIRSTKGDIDERLPFITFTDNARKVSMTIAKPRNFPKVEGRGKRVYDRGEDRRPREKNRDRGRRSTSPPGSSFNTRNNTSNRPHMSCYSLRRQSILRSIHRRSRTSGHDLASSRSRISRSYDDLLAEYQDIKSKLRHLIHEEKNLKSDDENSNEGSYGDKENRVYRRNGSSRVSRVENRTQINRQCRLSSRSSESHSPVVEGASKEDEEEEEDVLRKIALASKFKCKQASTLVASPVNEPQTVSSVNVDAEVKVEESSTEIAKETSLDVEEDEDLLRAQLLSSLTLKQLDKLDVIDLPENVPEIVRSSESVLGGKLSTEASNAAALFKLPVHKPLVINLKEDSDSETETAFPVQQKIASLDSIDDFIRAARNLSDVGVKNAETSSAVESPPLSVYNLPESELKEYKRLKAEIANREQNKQSGIIKKRRIVLQKSVASKEESLMLAEEKCIKSRESLLSQETELSKLVEQLNIDEKTLKATGLKICNLEQQLTAAKRLELLQKRRVAELKVKKLNLEQKVSVSKADNFKLQQVCLNIGKRVLGTEYKLPESGLTLKRLSLSQKVLPEDKKFNKSPIRKPRTRQASIGTNQGTNKSSEWAAEKSRLQKKQQELLSKLAELRKQALKASANKPNVTTRQVSQTVVQSLKRTRRQSLTKKSKKLRLSESETASADVESKPSCSLAAVTIEIEKKYVVDNTLSVEDISFEFHHFFTNEVPKLELRDTIKVSSTTNDIIPDSFLPYRSPLLVFRAYRFSPYFRIKSNQNLSWSTYCHGLKPKVTVCRYDLTGKCNDDKCRWQHAVNYVVSPEECLRDLVQYAPRMVEETADAKEGGIPNKLDGFVSNLLHCNQERMTLDQMCVLLVGRVNDYLNKVPPHFITFEERVDRFLIANATSSGMNRLTFDIKNKEDEREGLKWRINMELEPDGVCDESDVRYFEYDTQNNSTMQPVDEKGWMALAKKKLNSVGCSPPLCLDITLDILSRALESHTHSSCLWSFYLSLYARRQDCTDLMNLYRQAVTLAPNYDIWWQYLQSTKGYADKEALCEEILRYILQSEVDEDVKSHQILEILLYWAKLNVLTSKFDRAIQILEETLHRSPNKSCGVVHLVVDDMTSKDRCLTWLCYISLKVFHSLPNLLFSPENSGLGKVICKLPFILPWKSGGKWHLSIGDILDLFMDALRKCVLKGQPAKSNAQLCLPLYKNLIALELSRQRNQSAVKVCQQLRNVTSCDEAWITQACVYYRTSNFADLRKVMQLALSGTDATPVLFCFAIMFELKEKNISAATALCKRFLTSCNEDNLNVERVDEIDAVFRHLLNLPVEDQSMISSIQRVSSISTQMAYVWLIYCMYLITQEKHSDAKSAFETAILRLTEREDLEMIWLHYLDICLCQAVSLSKLISLISRCLNTVPCKVTLPGSNGDLAHVSYAFFNLVLDKYISPLEIDVQIVIYERFLIFAPNNSLLAIRLLSLYLIQGEYQMAWRLCYAQLERTPRNLELWKIALQLAFKNRSPNEIRDVYQHATEALPYSEFLWKEFHAYEVSRGEDESAKDLVTKCLEYGVCIES